jgi:hypothetical protein
VGGWLYLATVLDVFSRRVIGWAIAEHLRASLVCAALRMAIATRGGAVAGVVFHSDRGCQYTSAEFRDLCDAHGVLQSMGRTGVPAPRGLMNQHAPSPTMAAYKECETSLELDSSQRDLPNEHHVGFDREARSHGSTSRLRKSAL